MEATITGGALFETVERRKLTSHTRNQNSAALPEAVPLCRRWPLWHGRMRRLSTLINQGERSAEGFRSALGPAGAVSAVELSLLWDHEAKSIEFPSLLSHGSATWPLRVLRVRGW